MGYSSSELLKLALGATAGSIGTRWLTQTILGDKNTGAMGYGVSAGVAIALGWAANKFVGGKDLANGVVAGGLAAILMRIWQEQVSGTSPAALQGYLGDLDFSGGLGTYTTGDFVIPTTGYKTVAPGVGLPAQAGATPVLPGGSAAPVPMRAVSRNARG